MNVTGKLRKITELGIGFTAVSILALAGCGGGGGSGGGDTPPPAINIAGLVSTFAGNAGWFGYFNAASGTALFDSPACITSDGTNLYVTEMNNNSIRKISLATGAVSTLAGDPTGASGVSDGTGSAASFNLPRGIVSDGTYLYVADGGNNTIRKVTINTGYVSTVAGTAGASGVSNGTGMSARFNTPVGITKVGTNLYVSDYVSHTIRKIDISTASAVVSTFAGDGIAGYSTGWAGTSARFNFPSGLTNDGTNLYVADSGNNNIRQINISTQMVSTIAGSSWIAPNIAILDGGGTTNGTGTTAKFNSPFDITTDGTNLYVSDTMNHTIRKIVISSGLVTTLAGTAGSIGLTNGTGSTARFYKPRGIFYVNGALYVADWWNDVIRKIQ